MVYVTVATPRVCLYTFADDLRRTDHALRPFTFTSLIMTVVSYSISYINEICISHRQTDWGKGESSAAILENMSAIIVRQV